MNQNHYLFEYFTNPQSFLSLDWPEKMPLSTLILYLFFEMDIKRFNKNVLNVLITLVFCICVFNDFHNILSKLQI